jgi:hypothetical protein
MEYFGIHDGPWVGFSITDEGPDEILRFTATCTDEYPVTPPDMTEYILF